ncbi:MAG: hypothetical protein AB2693_13285, partial [Candidatus Thiodiazotropha sp.]
PAKLTLILNVLKYKLFRKGMYNISVTGYYEYFKKLLMKWSFILKMGSFEGQFADIQDIIFILIIKQIGKNVKECH